MFKKLLLITIISILATLLACCGESKLPETETQPVSEQNQAQEETKAEYIKISQQEAYDMMTADDVIILDVRTQDEFDSGHIINAVLLPDYEVEEKAESVIPDKNQIILVYCRTGRRSANASKKLIEMGYTKIYDFGGIVDWEYEIVED